MTGHFGSDFLQEQKDEADPEDWPEDFGLENGNYWCGCSVCGKYFIGYKRRTVCRECAMKREPK